MGYLILPYLSGDIDREIDRQTNIFYFSMARTMIPYGMTFQFHEWTEDWSNEVNLEAHAIKDILDFVIIHIVNKIKVNNSRPQTLWLN